ncbi:MAG: pyruvate formate-lyase-activating protein [Candidatus Omnitrophica bacterium]|nr:pyruvate formate-lyase-activating protein [Candidatus Omnitrophota bacterium]
MKICKEKEITGNIHSFETFGTHEGPGIRLVVFLQGCRARCLWCHNPDTWQEGAGKYIGVGEIMVRLNKCLPYIMSSKGGITVSGGEPLLQIDFLLELFRMCKEIKVHTAIDTSAFYNPPDEPKLPALLALTDLLIVDIKAANKKLHKRLTSRNLEQVTRFIDLLEDKKKQYWIRYCLTPGLNDAEGDLKELGKLTRGLRHCKIFEFLPYHILGKYKWEHLGLAYPLKDTRAATQKDIKRAERISIS